MKSTFSLLLLALCLWLPGQAIAQNPQSIRVYPDVVYTLMNVDQQFDVVVVGRNTQFTQGSTTLYVNFQQQRQGTMIKVMSDTMFVARIAIPAGTTPGNYQVLASPGQNGTIIQDGAFHYIQNPYPPTLPKTIGAVIFNDKNRNCAAEYTTEIDPRMARRVVQVVPGPYYNVTDEHGSCGINVANYGTYAVNRLPEPAFEPLCFKTGLYAVLSTSVQMVQRNFPDSVKTCNVKTRLLAKNLPYDNCSYSSNRVSVEVSGYGAKDLYVYRINRTVNAQGDTVETATPNFGSGPYSNVSAEKDTASIVFYTTGTFKVVALNQGGCRDSIRFNIDYLLPPQQTCAAHIDAYVSLHDSPNLCATDLSISAYTQGTSCFTQEPGTVRMYAWAPNGYQLVFQESFTGNYSLPAAGSSGTAVTGYVSPSYKFVVTAGCGAKDSVIAQRTDVSCNVQVTATGAYQGGSGSVAVTIVRDGYTCGLPVSARRLENNQMYYLPILQSGNRTFTGLPPGTYEVTAYNTATCVARDTAVVPGGFPITFGAGSDDYVFGTVRDGAGNVYASISFRGTISLAGTSLTSASATRRDMALAKFTDGGSLLWVKQIGNGQFDMSPQGINLDGSGRPFWAGSFAGAVTFAGTPNQVLTAAGSYDAFTARFDPATGNCKWARRVGGPGNDYLYACFVSNSGNVYAGGSYTGVISFQTGSTSVNLPNAGGLDGFIVKFDSSGNGIYASRLGSAADDEVKSIEYNGGDLVACGYMGSGCTFPTGTPSAPTSTVLAGINGSRDGFAGRVNSTGQWIWVKNFGSIYNDEAHSICLDPTTGNVFVAAQVADAPVTFNGVAYAGKGNNDIMVLGWNFYTQAAVWANRTGSSTGDSPNVIRWDGNRLVVAGYAGGTVAASPSLTLSSLGGQDAVLLRYDKATGAITSGQMLGGSGNDQALTLYCNTATREEYVGGIFSGSATLPPSVVRTSAGGYDGFLARVSPPSGARAGTEETAVAAVASTLKAYPVPFSSHLTIEASQPVQLLDLNGRVMAEATPARGQATLATGHLPAGIYLVRTADGRAARVVKQ